jgi:hypothetical protein
MAPVASAAPERHRKPVSCIATAPDGRRFASAADREIKIWAPAEKMDPALGLGRSVKTLEAAENVSSLAFTFDGNLLVGGVDGGLYLVGLESGKVETLLSGGGGSTVNSVACSAVAALAASGSQGTCGWDGVAVWDLRTGKRIKSLAFHRYVWSVAFSPDGKTILSVGWSAPAKNGAIELWDAESGAAVRELSHAAADNPYHAAFSSDGRYVVAGDHASGGATLYDAGTGARLRYCKPEGFGFASTKLPAGFSRDGMVVIAGIPDETLGFWDTATGVPVTRLQAINGDAVTTFAPTAEPRTILVGTQSGRVLPFVIPPVAGHPSPRPPDVDHGGKSGVSFTIRAGGRESAEVGRFDLAEDLECIVATIEDDAMLPTIYLHYYARFGADGLSPAQAQAIKALESATVSIGLASGTTLTSTDRNFLPGGGSNHSDSGTHVLAFDTPVKAEDLKELVIVVGNTKHVLPVKNP